MTPSPRVVLTCEHAGNDVPSEYADLFDAPEAREALDGHRGWDPGSLALGKAMAGVLDAPLVIQPVTRLLVECNRSLDHPRLFSEFSARLGPVERRRVVDRYWWPHRERVRALLGVAEGGRGVGRGRTRIAGCPRGDPTVHVGVHTFTPVWRGRERKTDIGLLYDPARAAEAEVARRWRREIHALLPPSSGPPRVHLNRPYRGWTDGLTTALRRELAESRYVGIELEVSQRFSPAAGEIGRRLGATLKAALSGPAGPSRSRPLRSGA